MSLAGPWIGQDLRVPQLQALPFNVAWNAADASGPVDECMPLAWWRLFPTQPKTTIAFNRLPKTSLRAS